MVRMFEINALLEAPGGRDVDLGRITRNNMTRDINPFVDPSLENLKCNKSNVIFYTGHISLTGAFFSWLFWAVSDDNGEKSLGALISAIIFSFILLASCAAGAIVIYSQSKTHSSQESEQSTPQNSLTP